MPLRFRMVEDDRSVGFPFAVLGNKYFLSRLTFSDNSYSEYSAQVTFRDRMQEGVYCNMLYGQIPDIVKEKIGE